MKLWQLKCKFHWVSMRWCKTLKEKKRGLEIRELKDRTIQAKVWRYRRLKENEQSLSYLWKHYHAIQHMCNYSCRRGESRAENNLRKKIIKASAWQWVNESMDKSMIDKQLLPEWRLELSLSLLYFLIRAPMNMPGFKTVVNLAADQLQV